MTRMATAAEATSIASDISQPGVPAVTNYLQSLPRPVNANCQKGHYYLVNNYNPGYNGDGTLTSQYSPFTIPPVSVKSIGDSLIAKNIPFKYYGEDWDLYVTDPTESAPFDAYCNICNPFQYQTQIMGTQATREKYIADTTALYEDIDLGTLPPVSVVKPSGYNDGHPASSKLDLFEGFVKEDRQPSEGEPGALERYRDHHHRGRRRRLL